MSATAIPPARKPSNPNFSSGPCAKRPGWTLPALQGAVLGRSHRSRPGKAKLKEAIELTRSVLGIPADYRIGIVPGSDTGAVEMALWGLLGPRGVDVLAWESFGQDWVTDVTSQLELDDRRVLQAPYGELPDLSLTDSNRDIIFTWNGTTSGVRVPDADWISDTRKGLTICDATSAAFAMKLPWQKLDVTTWSWQKVLGGEGAHGIIVLSPRALARLVDHTPHWPMPKVFRLLVRGAVNEGIFEGETINTPSMLVVEDAIDGLKWAQSIGGLPALIEHCESNLALVTEWQRKSPWCDFLAVRPEIRSCTSICLKIGDPQIVSLAKEEQALFVKTMVDLLDRNGVAYDIAAYRSAPPGLRIWAGATVMKDDLSILLEWLDYAYSETWQRKSDARCVDVPSA
jgi:phosphoserine aminotransferase